MTRREWSKAALAAIPACALRAEPARRMEAPGAKHQPEPALSELLAKLKDCTERRDLRALMQLIGPKFRVEFDSGKGPAAFQSLWRPQGKESRVWGVLARLLELDGYAYSETLYVKPHVYARFPIDLNPLEHVVAAKDEVPLRESGAESGKKVADVGREILRLDEALTPPVILNDGWTAVTSGSGARGYVLNADVYSPAGHRMFFEKRAGRWVWFSLACASFRGVGERG